MHVVHSAAQHRHSRLIQLDAASSLSPPPTSLPPTTTTTTLSSAVCAAPFRLPLSLGALDSCGARQSAPQHSDTHTTPSPTHSFHQLYDHPTDRPSVHPSARAPFAAQCSPAFQRARARMQIECAQMHLWKTSCCSTGTGTDGANVCAATASPRARHCRCAHSRTFNL